ncbi:hypothetical protein [Streptomyces sp. BHT-5-2]|uniref:hypothetical protein n=1 Tax=Streptomyces sp. BHT-5-2 TaxID=2866715 RepID=UPI0021B0A90A|nr:hypothetical protein [Streptomyces sp. BHT-5-2]
MTSPRTRRVLPALLLTVALTTTGTAGAADSQIAPARTALTGAANKTADTTSADPAASVATLQRTAFTAEDSCTRLSASARPKVRDAVTACVSVHNAPGASTAASKKAAAFTPSSVTHLANSAADEPGDAGTDPEFEPDTDDPEPPPPSCELTNPGQWSWSRTGGLCLNGVDVTYTLYDQSGKSIGTGLIQVSSTLATSYKSLDLKETITAKLVRVTGAVKNLVVKMQVGCDAGCKTVTKQPWYGSTPMTPGEVKTGTTKYSGDAFAEGTTRSSFQTSYKLYVMMPGAAPVDPSASCSSPANGKIRCDKEQPRLRGCVIPSDELPVLTYSRSHAKYGIVVPIYEEIIVGAQTSCTRSIRPRRTPTAPRRAHRSLTCTQGRSTRTAATSSHPPARRRAVRTVTCAPS